MYSHHFYVDIYMLLQVCVGFYKFYIKFSRLSRPLGKQLQSTWFPKDFHNFGHHAIKEVPGSGDRMPTSLPKLLQDPGKLPTTYLL